MTLVKIPLGIMPSGIMTLGIIPPDIMTLGIMSLKISQV